MTKYEYRHREIYKNMLVDVRAHTEDDLHYKVAQRKQKIDAQYNVYAASTTSVYAGDIGEFAAMAFFVREGFVVSKPLTANIKYDFIADYGGRLFKVQVKTTRKPDDSGAMSFRLSSSNLVSGKWQQNLYTASEVDLFFLYCIETDWKGIYIPREHEYLRASITVRNFPKENSRAFSSSSLDAAYQLGKITGNDRG